MQTSHQIRYQQEMFSLVEQWLMSNKSKSEFAKENKLSVERFQYWFKKYERKSKQETDTASFVSLVPPKITTLDMEIKILYPNGVQLSLSDCNIENIISLIKIY